MVLSRMEGVSKDDVLTFLREYKTRECGGCEQLIGFQRRATGALVCDPNCSGKAAAVMEGGGAGGVSKQDVLNFLRQYKTLECHCCDQLIGFQHRGTGLVFCNPDCASGGAAQGAVGVKPLGELRLNKSGAEGIAIKGHGVPNGIITPRAAVTESKKEHVVEVVGSTVPPRKTQDVPDGSGIIYTAGGLAKRAPPCESAMASDLFSSTNSFKTTDRNPFMKTVPVLTSKETAPPPPKPKTPEVEVAKIEPDPNEGLSVDDPRYRFLWKFAKYSPFITDMCNVKISFAWSVREFQVVAEDDEQRVVAYQEKVQQYVRQRAETLTEPPVNGQMVFAEYLNDYYRARVTDVNGTKCSVFFVDFGDRQKDVEFSTLYKAERELMEAPVYSIYVALDDVPELKRKAKLKGDLEVYMYENVFTLKLVDPIQVGKNDDIFNALLMDRSTPIGPKVKEHLKGLPDASKYVDVNLL